MARQPKKIDGRKNNGGARKGAGRKKKFDELELQEKLTPMDEKAFKALEKGIISGDFKYVQMYLQYKYGKPQDKLDITTGGEAFDKPLISFFNKKKK